MTQDQALKILKTGASVFLTGEPGAGKSYTIKTYIDYLINKGVTPSVTASTGIASTHIGGMTIHSWTGLGIKKDLSIYDLESMLEKEYVVKRVTKAKVLIIDEISMLSSNTLDMIERVCSYLRPESDKAFGGLQVIFVGDFFQLPPIVKNTDKISTLEMFENSNLAFGSNAWKKLNPLICYLTEQHRQSDQEFVDVLKKIRENKVDTDIHNILQKRIVKKNSENIALLDSKKITKLYSHNIHVDKVNNLELGLINEKTKIYEMKRTGKEFVADNLMKNCLSPYKLELKKGAKVMCTKNNPEKGFVNGSVGVIVKFSNTTTYPIVRFTNAKGFSKEIEIEPMDWSVEDGGKKVATISQIPLRLAWAITIHKSQGMSLDEAMMDISNVFEYGQGYVALSRVRTLDGLYLIGYNEMALKVHHEVLEKDLEFKDSSEEIDEEFSKIMPNELNKLHDNYVRSIAKNPKDIIEDSKSSGKYKKYSSFKRKKKIKVDYDGGYDGGGVDYGSEEVIY
jgi:ATP-dependent DNA helicase PIF1